MGEAIFLSAMGKLRASDAVAGLIVTEDGRYIMQLRDANPDIFYPDHWGCFGGAVDEGENPVQALRRELREELEFEIYEANEFIRFDFDLTTLGQGKVFRIYYELVVSLERFSRFVLHEGVLVRAFTAREILTQQRMTPYDAYAIWLHARRSRFQS
jgi:8-oxo-dGTP pyrophosphatase MutT (NUDIX family)